MLQKLYSKLLAKFSHDSKVKNQKIHISNTRIKSHMLTHFDCRTSMGISVRRESNSINSCWHCCFYKQTMN